MTTINGRDVILLIDAIDRSDECSTISFGAGTRQTFADMRGRAPKVMNLVVTQDLEATSLYRMALADDTTAVAGLIKPLGNEVASATEPHYSFMVKPVGTSGDVIMGGEASEDASEDLTVEISWLITNWLEVTV